MQARRMDAHREPPLDPAGLRALLSPSVIVSLALAAIAATLALVYLVRGDAAGPARAEPAASAPSGPAAGAATASPAPPPEPVEFRCVDGLRVRKQGNSYTGDGRC